MQSSQGVLHVVTSLDFGGVESHMQIIANHACDSAFEHSFVAIAGGGATALTLQKSRASVDCLACSAKIPSFKAFWALFKYIRSFKPAVIHCHGSEANFHGLLAGRLAGVPVCVGEEIGIPQQSSTAKRVFSYVFKQADAVIGISDAVSRWLEQHNGLAKNKSVRLYNPVQFSALRKTLPAKRQSIRIGFVGRLEEVKNPLALVQAVHALREEFADLELWLIGDGSQRPQIERYIAQHQLEAQVSVCGFQSEPDRLLVECDLYVQPSLSEGFGLALCEAMGVELPVLATAVGGVPEIIRQDQTGWIIQESSSEALEKALREILALPIEQLQQMGRAAKESVTERFTPSIYLTNLDALYQRLLRKRGRA